jgi:hypothetical protein
MSAPAEEADPMTAPNLQRSVEMSLAEKLACEREARHDVLSRGRMGDAAAVQHYLAHLRCEDGRHPRSSPAARRHRAHHHEDEAVSRSLRQWLRWGEDGTAGAPVIPRC